MMTAIDKLVVAVTPLGLVRVTVYVAAELAVSGVPEMTPVVVEKVKRPSLDGSAGEIVMDWTVPRIVGVAAVMVSPRIRVSVLGVYEMPIGLGSYES